MERTYRFRITEAQYRDAVKHSTRRLLDRSGIRPLLTILNIAFVLACVGIGLNLDGARPYLMWSLAAAFGLLVAMQIFARRAVMKGLTHGNEGLFAEQTLVISETGVRIERGDVHATLGWSAIKAIEVVKSQILIFVDSGSAISVPDSVFPSMEERQEFLREIETRCGAEKHPPVPSSVVEAPITPPTSHALAGRSFWTDLRGNLKAGFRMAMFLPVAESSVRATWSQLVALIGVQLAVIWGFGVVLVGAQGQLNLYGLPGIMFGTVLALAAAWALAMLSGSSDRAFVLLVAFSALAVPLEIFAQLFSIAINKQIFRYRGFGAVVVYSLPHYWLAVAAGVAAIRLLSIARVRRFAAMALALMVLAPAAIYEDKSIWIKPYDVNEQAALERQQKSLAKEDLFYLQPKLLERELANLQPGRKGTIDLYFIGGAGWASQDVFMKEVQSVSKLFEEKFGTQGRTVRLINNSKTAAEIPIASTTSLKRALNRVGEIMDRDEDIVFLFLTSHGSREHQFSLEFYPLKFNELTPALLKRMLDESGIKRRVLVVSACYSGGFIDALKDENSLVITASAPDKNSFGCSNEADFTYFGKAYFDEALRETYSFIEAFEIAKPRIVEREKKSDYTPSDPRIFIGDAIRAPLAELERGLRQGTAK